LASTPDITAIVAPVHDAVMACGEFTLGSVNYGCASAATSGDTLICFKPAEIRCCWECLIAYAGAASRLYGARSRFQESNL